MGGAVKVWASEFVTQKRVTSAVNEARRNETSLFMGGILSINYEGSDRCSKTSEKLSNEFGLNGQTATDTSNCIENRF